MTYNVFGGTLNLAPIYLSLSNIPFYAYGVFPFILYCYQWSCA